MEKMEENKKSVSIDEMLCTVGEYGRFQKIVNVMLCIMTLPCVYQIMIMFFAADDPGWKCRENSSNCLLNGTYSSSDERRCNMGKYDWEYARSSEYSLVVYFDVHCTTKWLLELLTSIFFLGWLLGAFILGWVCDNYGRIFVLILSTNVIMLIGFVSIFMPNIYLLIACRFVIGFFLPGTFMQSFIIITELVGSKHRPFAGLMIFVFCISGLTVLGVKAYFIQNWKYLHIACTAPYLFIVFFFAFLPESVRYLRVKGKMEELMVIFRRIAYWNKTEISPDITVSSPPKEAAEHKSNPAHLFKTKYLAKKTCVQTAAYFVAGLVYYGVYLAAGDLGGSMHRNYIIISACEVPIIFLSMDFCERFGRKHTTTFPMLFTCFACAALSFLPSMGDWRIGRVITGIIGKCLVGSNMNTLATWSTELYTTQVRGEAIGFFQAFMRLGAATAPWVDKELVKVHKSAPFIFMAVASLVSFLLLQLLPETKDVVTADAEGEEGEENEKDLQLQVMVASEIKMVNNELVRSSYTNSGLEGMD